MDVERLGELCAGVEVVPGCVWMWRDWVSSAGVEAVPGCVLIWRAGPQQRSVISVTRLTLVQYGTYNGDVNWC